MHKILKISVALKKFYKENQSGFRKELRLFKLIEEQTYDIALSNYH